MNAPTCGWGSSTGVRVFQRFLYDSGASAMSHRSVSISGPDGSSRNSRCVRTWEAWVTELSGNEWSLAMWDDKQKYRRR